MLLFPNYDNLQVASMLAADLEFIIILKDKLNRRHCQIQWGEREASGSVEIAFSQL